jgi:hypothetical protein
MFATALTRFQGDVFHFAHINYGALFLYWQL